MNRYNPNAKWAVLMCRHAKNNTEIRNIESKYRDWQSAGFDKGLLAPGKKLYKQVKGTSGRDIVQKHKAIGSQTVCEKEFQTFVACMTKYNYDNLPCSQPYLKYMKCVKGHQAQKRLDKQVDPETIPPRAPNGMKLKRYTITKQQEWTKFQLDADAQRVQSNILRKRDSLIIPGHVDPKLGRIPNQGMANKTLNLNEGPTGGRSAKKYKYL